MINFYSANELDKYGCHGPLIETLDLFSRLEYLNLESQQLLSELLIEKLKDSNRSLFDLTIGELIEIIDKVADQF